MPDVDETLRRRLRQMGVTQGLAGLKSDAGPKQPRGRGARATLPGGERSVGDDVFWLDLRHYAGDFVHGTYALADLETVSEEALARLGVPDLGPRPAFLDTETTGLAGGAGTLAFEIGAGLWNGDSFDLHLLLMRDPDEEGAALTYLTEVLSKATGIVTFNGRGFDLPILETRYVLNRMPPVPLALPHLDLLTTARQLWRDHLASRRLGVLEEEILGVRRTEQDLDSGLIPWMYRQYLETGDPADMVRVLYHNEIDVLSLVSLLVHVARMVVTPQDMALAAAEWVGVGRVYDKVGDEPAAIDAWQVALSGDPGELASDCAARVWGDVGRRYRRRRAWTEALAIWDAWEARLPGAVEPLVEKAKYHEWMTKELDQAMACTECALARAVAHPSGLRRFGTVAELQHRRDRLERKLARDRDQG